MCTHGMVYFLLNFNAHQNTNYCILEGHGSVTLFTRPFLSFCVGGARHETRFKHCLDDINCSSIYLCTGGALGWMSGVVNLALSWRWTFHILGIAGLVMTPVAIMAVYEPKTVRLKRRERMKGKQAYTILVRSQSIDIDPS